MFPVLRSNATSAPFVTSPINRLESLFDRVFGDDGGFVSQAWPPLPVAIWGDDDHIYIEAEVPGVAENDVDVTVHNGMLFIRGERKRKRAGDPCTTASGSADSSGSSPCQRPSIPTTWRPRSPTAYSASLCPKARRPSRGRSRSRRVDRLLAKAYRSWRRWHSIAAHGRRLGVPRPAMGMDA